MKKKKLIMFWEFLVIFLLTSSSSRVYGFSESPPQFLEEPADLVVGRHQPATLECRAKGNPPPVIHWFKDGIPVTQGGPGAARRVLLPAGGLFFLRATHARRDTDQGIYWCEARNRLGTIRSRNASLQVALLREDFRLEPADTRGAAGDSALLECAPPRGVPEPVVLWRKNGQIMDLENSDRIRIVDGGNLIIQDLRQSDDGKYQCLAKNFAGTRESSIAHLRVHVKPYLIAGPSDAVALVGGSVTFHCRVGGDPLPDVLWRRAAGGGNMPLGRIHILEDRSLRLDGIELEDQGEYSCEADNTVGSITASGMLKVHSPPYFDIKPIAQSVEVGSDALYECLAKGNPRPTLFWSLEGNHTLLFPGFTWGKYKANISFDGKSTLILNSAEKKDSGTTVVCSAVNTAGAVTTRAKLLVTSDDDRPPPVIILGPSNQTLPLKSLAEFHCSATGSPDPVISWYHKSAPILPTDRINISETGTLTIKHLEKDDSGTYTCVASNKNGKYVWSATLKVDSPMNPNIHFFRAPNPLTLPGAPGAPQTINQSDSSVTISWSPNTKSGSSSLVGYQVEMFARDNFASGKYESKWTIVARRIEETTYTQKMLNAGGSYTFFVRAENSHGLSSPSLLSETFVSGGDNEIMLGVDEGIGSALVAEARASLQADEVVRLNDAFAVESHIVKLAWETINSYNLEGFHIYYRPLDASNTTSGAYKMQTVLHTGSTSGFAISGLMSYTNYEFFLVPFYKNIDGRPSNSRIARTLEDAPSEAPSHLEAYLLNSTSVYLKWKPPPYKSHKGVIQFYHVIVREAGNGSLTIHNVTVVGSNTRLGGLVPGNSYWLQIAAATSRGTGPYTQPAALKLPLTPSNIVESKILDSHYKRNSLEQNPQQIDSADLLKEIWFIALLVAMLFLIITIVVGGVFVRRRYLMSKKNGLQNLYDSHTVGSNLITQLNMKGVPGISSNYAKSFNQNSITKTDSLMWMGNRGETWRESNKVRNNDDFDHQNSPRNLPEYDKINTQSLADYAEVDAAMITYRKNSVGDSKNSFSGYAVPVVGNDKTSTGTMGWIQMCAGSKNKVDEDPEEEVYPSNNGGYFNRNIYADSSYSGDYSNMFKFDSLPHREGSIHYAQNIPTSSRSSKEKSYGSAQTPGSTMKRSHKLQIAKSQNLDNASNDESNNEPVAYEIRTTENPFSIFDDQDIRLSDIPDDDKEYFGHVQPMKLISHQYTRPLISRPSPNGKTMSSFATLKNVHHPKPEYHSSTRSEPGNE